MNNSIFAAFDLLLLFQLEHPNNFSIKTPSAFNCHNIRFHQQTFMTFRHRVVFMPFLHSKSHKVFERREFSPDFCRPKRRASANEGCSARQEE